MVGASFPSPWELCSSDSSSLMASWRVSFCQGLTQTPAISPCGAGPRPGPAAGHCLPTTLASFSFLAMPSFLPPQGLCAGCFLGPESPPLVTSWSWSRSWPRTGCGALPDRPCKALPAAPHRVYPSLSSLTLLLLLRCIPQWHVTEHDKVPQTGELK